MTEVSHESGSPRPRAPPSSMKALLASYMDSASSSLTGPPLTLPPDVELSLEVEPGWKKRSTAGGSSRRPSAASGVTLSRIEDRAAGRHLSGEMIRRILERSKDRSKPGKQPPLLLSREETVGNLGEAVLWGEAIAAFSVGGEARCCLPQILNSVLGSVSLSAIHSACDELRIYCPTCTPGQLAALKSAGIIPPTAAQCGLIRKSDALRLFSLLLDRPLGVFRVPPPGLRVLHECFGTGRGLLSPGMYSGPSAACLTCLECGGAFSPPRFVAHVHSGAAERSVVHWGFDSGNWRAYLRLDEEVHGEEGSRDWEDGMRLLDEVKARYATPNGGERSSLALKRSISEVEGPGPKKARVFDSSLSSIYNLYNTWAAALVSSKAAAAAVGHPSSHPSPRGSNSHLHSHPPPSKGSLISHHPHHIISGHHHPALPPPSSAKGFPAAPPGNGAAPGFKSRSRAEEPSSSSSHLSEDIKEDLRLPLPPLPPPVPSSSSHEDNNNEEVGPPQHLLGGSTSAGPGPPSAAPSGGIPFTNSSLAEDISAIRDALEGASAVAKERTLKTLERITARLAQTELERDLAIANLQDLQRQNSETVKELFKKRAELRELLAQDSASSSQSRGVTLEYLQSNALPQPSEESLKDSPSSLKAEEEPSLEGKAAEKSVVELKEEEEENEEDSEDDESRASISKTTTAASDVIAKTTATTHATAATTTANAASTHASNNNGSSATANTDGGRRHHNTAEGKIIPHVKDSEDLRERMVYMEAELRALRQELKARVVHPASPPPPPPPVIKAPVPISGIIPPQTTPKNKKLLPLEKMMTMKKSSSSSSSSSSCSNSLSGSNSPPGSNSSSSSSNNINNNNNKQQQPIPSPTTSPSSFC